MQLNLMGLFGLLFVGLKLTGYLTWSWWLVLLPFWIGVPLVILWILIAALVVGLAKGR
ncbi:hypothetical protein ACQZ6C_10685 [Rhizobium rhizogenes]